MTSVKWGNSSYTDDVIVDELMSTAGVINHFNKFKLKAILF